MNDNSTDALPAEDDNQQYGNDVHEQPPPPQSNEAQPFKTTDVHTTLESELLLIDGIIFLRLPPL
jgi:hypothetical protein